MCCVFFSESYWDIEKSVCIVICALFVLFLSCVHELERLIEFVEEKEEKFDFA